MSLKKFISGVAAIAIAASAFAAMALMASATDYNKSIAVKTQTSFTRMSSYSDDSGVAKAATWSGDSYALVKRDFSDFEDIGDATSVTLSFDTYVYANTPTYYGVGDGVNRSSCFNSNGTYRTTGLAMFFGSNGSAYGAYNVKAASYAFTDNTLGAKLVNASFTFNKDAGTITYNIGGKPGTIATDISNLTYIEVATTKSGGQFGLKNVTVSYTVPEPTEAPTAAPTEAPTAAPSAPSVGDPSEVSVENNVSGDGVYAKAFTSAITYNGIAIENVAVTVPGSKEGSQTLTFGGVSGDVRIGIIIASKDSSKIAGITPTVTVNVE